MSATPDFEAGSHVGRDRVPGAPPDDGKPSLAAEIRGYVLGLVLSAALTAASFWAVGTHLIYPPGIMMAIVVLAVAQMGIHLVFFLHLTTAPDNTNNVLALAFGVLIVGLVVFGSVWVMNHLNHNMMPAHSLTSYRLRDEHVPGERTQRRLQAGSRQGDPVVCARLHGIGSYLSVGRFQIRMVQLTRVDNLSVIRSPITQTISELRPIRQICLSFDEMCAYRAPFLRCPPSAGGPGRRRLASPAGRVYAAVKCYKMPRPRLECWSGGVDRRSALSTVPNASSHMTDGASSSGPERDSRNKALRLHGTIARRLGIAIVSGHHRAGELLGNEIASSEQFAVSRSAYREAVRILAAKGLVDARPKVGTRVNPRSKWHLLDPDVLDWTFQSEPDLKLLDSLFELRNMVESAAAGLAAMRRSAAQLQAMRAALEGMARHTLATEAGRQADLDFHSTLLNATHNPYIISLTDGVSAAINTTTVFKQRKRPLLRDPLPDHLRVFEAIAANNAAQAQQAMSELINLARIDTPSSRRSRRARNR